MEMQGKLRQNTGAGAETGGEKMRMKRGRKKLRLGIPKGSLQEATLELLKGAGLEVALSGRSYYPKTNDPEVEIVMARAQEMARYVEKGVIDAGITGADWVRENKADVEEISELLYAKQGMNHVRWVLAVPEGSGIKTAADLGGKLIATELVNATKEWLGKKGIEAKVEFSWGATETKCPALADAIVELTETGASLRVNKLRIVETVMESSTRLIANKGAWRDKWKREKIKGIDMLLQSVLLGRRKSMLEMNVSEENLKKLVKVLPCMKSPTVAKLLGKGGYAVKVAIDKEEVPQTIRLAKRNGATDILEFAPEKVVK